MYISLFFSKIITFTLSFYLPSIDQTPYCHIIHFQYNTIFFTSDIIHHHIIFISWSSYSLYTSLHLFSLFSPQALTMRRHKLWVLMAKKEVGRCQKSKASFRKEVLQNCKRMATGCMRVCRQKALQVRGIFFPCLVFSLSNRFSCIGFCSSFI